MKTLVQELVQRSDFIDYRDGMRDMAANAKFYVNTMRRPHTGWEHCFDPEYDDATDDEIDGGEFNPPF